MRDDQKSIRPMPGLDARITSVIRYWDQLRGDRPVPGRVELRPTALSRHLSRLCILERPRAGTVRMRLAGAMMSTRMGMELRGMPFRALFEMDDRAAAMDAAEVAISTPSVSILSLSRSGRSGPTAEATMAILPLSDTRGALTRAMAIYSERPAMTPYVDGVRGRFLISKVWSLDIPETGRLLGPLGGYEAATPLAKAVARMAQGHHGAATDAIETDPAAARPLFRVIDGGLT